MSLLYLLQGSNLATPDLQGLTAFHLAVLSDSLDCLEAVLQLVSAEILEFPSAEGLTPLMLAAQNGNVEVSLSVIDFFAIYMFCCYEMKVLTSSSAYASFGMYCFGTFATALIEVGKIGHFD